MKAFALPALAVGTALAWDLCAEPDAAPTNQPAAGPLILSTLRTNTFSYNRLQPGVYETRPFTCIVVVPAAHLDDKIVAGTKGGQPPMPMITPGLEFIPHHPGKK